MSRSVKFGVALAAVFFVAVLIYSTLRQGQVTVEVCMEFNAGRKCVVAAAPTEQQAVRTAADNACAFLASGRDQSMACSRTRPASVRRVED